MVNTWLPADMIATHATQKTLKLAICSFLKKVKVLWVEETA